MPIMEIISGENNSYNRRYAYDSAYNSSQIQIGGRESNYGSTYGDALCVGFLRFNLSALQNINITRATLKLYLDYLIDPLDLRIAYLTTDIDISEINSSIDDDLRWSSYDATNLYPEDEGEYFSRVVTSLIRNFVNGETATDIIVLWHYDDITNMGRGGIGGFSSENPPILEVEYSYPTPVNPANLSPNNINIQREKEITVEWDFQPAFSGDIQTAFEVEYSENNGVTWSKITEMTTRQNYTFSYVSLTTGSLRWRVRTRNSNNLWSDWVNAEFTWTQILPTRPQQLSPDGIQTDVLPTATWVYTPFNEEDGQTAFELEYSEDGGANYTNVLQVTTSTSYSFPSSLRGGLIKWRVRAKSSYFNLFTPWSEFALWTYAIPPQNPIFTSGTNFATPVPTITWTSPEQISFQLEVVKDEEVIFATGERNTQHRSYKIETFLENQTTYTIRVRVKNAVPLWSEWVEKEIYIDFEETDQPLIYVAEDTKVFGVGIRISNPITVLENEIWRRETGGQWIRIAKGLIMNATYVDYGVKSNMHYEYRVRAIAEQSYSDSEIATRKIKVKDSQLISTSDPSKYVKLAWNPKKNSKKSIQQKLIQYSGRKYPCTIWGDEEEYSIDVSFKFKIDGLMALEELQQMKETLLFRDSRGRKEYVTIMGPLNIEDDTDLGDFYVTAFKLQVVDYKEEV